MKEAKKIRSIKIEHILKKLSNLFDKNLIKM